MKELNEVELRDIIEGCTVLGTGGGGDPQEGWNMVKNIIQTGKRIKMISIDELSEESIVVVPYFVGSIAPDVRCTKKVKIKDPIYEAFKRMEKYLGKKIAGVVASELGGGNTAVALSIAGKLDIPIIDGDLLGRAAPELHQCTVHIFGIPMYPSVVVTESGDIVMIESYADIDDYESLVRYISVLGGRFSAVVDTPMSVKEAKDPLVKGTLTLGLKIGNVLRESRNDHIDPIKAIVDVLSGWLIFKGVVKKYKWKNENGFLKGEVEVEGVEEYKGHILKSWIMNEHILGWIDNDVAVLPPDLLIFLKDDGTPITNTVLKENMKINAIAAKASEKWRTSKGLEFFGPRKFGFDYEYIPVEKLVRR